MYTRVGECLINTEKLLEVRPTEQGLLLRLGEHANDTQAVGLILPYTAARASEFFSRFVNGQAVIYLNEVPDSEITEPEVTSEVRQASRLILR